MSSSDTQEPRPGHLQASCKAGTGFALFFAPGSRPDQAAVLQLFETVEFTALAAQPGHCPPADEGWLEILASGLTFDLTGLAPTSVDAVPLAGQDYGFAPGKMPQGAFEAIMLVPSVHIAAGIALPPVFRSMASLAANLAEALGAVAIGWESAGTLIKPAFFARAVYNWLGGGAFPALGLTALVPGGEGAVTTRGLTFFTGREASIERRVGESDQALLKLSIRIIDYLVAEGAFTDPREVTIGEERVVIEPSRVGKQTWIWRSG